MPRAFYQATAELTIQVVEAVYVNHQCDLEFVHQFCDVPSSQAMNALELATDLGLIKKSGDRYKPDSPLIKFICTPDVSKKAALLRIMLESYLPFIHFRERLLATGSADTAAQQTKTILGLDSHREEIKDTLISLGTYAKAILAKGGGKYVLTDEKLANQLHEIAESCDDLAAAEVCIRTEIGDYSEQLDRTEVIMPLASALIKAKNKKPTEAVAEAAMGVESYLARLASRNNVSLTGATGLNSRLDKFRPQNILPKKVVEAGKYLGQVRNAADHGVDVDSDVDAVWHILESTGIQYVFVACSFIRACGARENNENYYI